MREFKETQEPKGTVTTVVEAKKKKVNPYGAIAIVAALALLVIVGVTILCVNLHSKNKVLADELERQMKLAADLEAHVNGLETDNNTLSGKLNELLNVQDAEPVITSKQIEEQLSAISELATQAYMYTNAEREEDQKTWINGWSMPFSEKSFVAKYDGTIKAGIDLSEIKIEVKEEDRIITVTLPKSVIIDHNVPQDKIEVFGIKDGLFNKVDPNDPNALIAKGKEAMEEKAIERGLLTEADQEAQALIRAFLALIPGMDTYKLEIK